MVVTKAYKDIITGKRLAQVAHTHVFVQWWNKTVKKGDNCIAK
jgi:hypothetical protein